MKIKYLKDAPQGKVGEVKEVYDPSAKVLIKLGFAEEFVEPVKVDEKPKGSGKNQNSGGKKAEKGQDDVQELV